MPNNHKREMREKVKREIRRHYTFVMAEGCGKAFAHWEDRKTPMENDYINAILSALSQRDKKLVERLEKEKIQHIGLDGKDYSGQQTYSRAYNQAIDQAIKLVRENK